MLTAYALGPFGFECFIVCFLAAGLCQLHLIVLALEAACGPLTLHHFFCQGLLPLSILQPGTVEVRGSFYDCADLREIWGQAFPIVLLVVPFGIKDGAHLEKL